MINSKRIKRIRKEMNEYHIDNLIITNPTNLIYLSNFHGQPGDGCLIINQNQIILITDSRYELEMRNQLANSPIQLNITSQYFKRAKEILDNTNGKIGFEDSISFNGYQKLKQLFNKRLTSTHELVERIRYVKDDDEINTIQHSCNLADKAYQAILNYIHPGLSERNIELFIYNWLIEHGASKPSFNTIVASGYRTALPHGAATNKIIHSGELVTIDFGFYYHDYTFDMTRTFAIEDPGNELKKVYSIVQTAQSKMIQTMQDGADTHQVDATARNYINQQGYGKYFNHGSGHGIGLDIHENPIINMSKGHHIKTNYVMTAEPGIYLPNKGGIRIEDDLLITSNGTKRLTHSNRDLIIVHNNQ